ncbi:MAG: phospholipase [Bacteroides sp.]|nr:phospholipase [Bacteroides sp.]MBD5285074.1 phospholipase [Bacteroides sp.]
MEVSLIIIGALVVTGILLYLFDRRQRLKSPDAEPAYNEPEEACCGMHITCEKDSLLASVSREIVYYDDEELDAFKGRGADEYNDQEIEQFRDVLLTLLPQDIAGWGRSVQLRGIELPASVRDELLMIVAEARSASTK